MLDAEMRDRINVALRTHNLKGLADELRRDGLTQVATYDLIEAFYSELGEAGRVADEDELVGALDRIWGWCNRSAMWFDNTLTDEAVRAYRDANRESGESPEPGDVAVGGD